MFCFSRLDLTCISESWACQELDQSLPFSGNCFDHRLTSGGEQGCLSSGVFPQLLLFPSFWLDPTHSFLSLLPHFCTPFFENDPARVEHCLKPLLWQLKIWTGTRSSGSLNWIRGLICTSSQVTAMRGQFPEAVSFDFGQGGGCQNVCGQVDTFWGERVRAYSLWAMGPWLRVMTGLGAGNCTSSLSGPEASDW